MPLIQSPDPGTTETRLLVCEGQCNRGIYDYDTLRAQHLNTPVANSGDLRRSGAHHVLSSMGSGLAHTLHVLVQGVNWSPRHGWVRKWRCTKCNHHRYF